MAHGRSSLVLALLTVCALPPARTQSLLFKDYTTQDGLPDSRVAPLLQDRAGYLWFGTQAGLTRYDGRSFMQFGPAHELPGIFGRSILQDHAGALWFGYTGFREGGIARLAGGTPVIIDHGGGLHGRQVVQVVEDTRGDLWAGTDAGVEQVHFTDSSRTRWSIDCHPDSATMGVHVDRSGVLWYASKRGLFRRGPDGWSAVYRAARSDSAFHIRPTAFYESPDGEFWIGGYSGAYRVEGKTVRHFSMPDGLPERGVWCFQRDLDGTFYAGTMNGLYRRVEFHGTTRFVREPSFGDAIVYDMCLDREGNLWFASAPGLRRLLRIGKVLEFPGERQIASAGIGPIAVDPSGTLYFGSRNTGLYVQRPDGLFRRSLPPPHANQTITSILATGTGRLWLGLWRGGSCFLAGNAARMFTVDSGFPSANAFAATAAHPGTILAGTPGGIAFIGEHGSLDRRDLPSLNRRTIFDLKFHGADTLWAATDDGVRLIFLHGSTADTVPTPAPVRALEGRIVYEMLNDSRGGLWLATDGTGVARFDGSTLTRYTRDDGLAGDRVFALTEDSTGNIWIGTSSGLTCFNGRSFRSLTYADGFGEIGVHGLLTDREGNVWVSSYPGVRKLKPLGIPGSPSPPPLYLTDVQVESRHLDPALPAELDPDPAVITFRLAALSFSDERNVRYRYRLEGFDADWSPPLVAREVRYTHLPPGEYRFGAIARSGDGVWTPESLTYAFAILPPVWARWWFLLGAACTIAGSVYLFYRYRLNKLLELERTRSRIAMDLHDDIGSSLTKISVMTEVGRRQGELEPALGLATLARIGDTARDLIESLSDIVWTVDPEHDSLQNLIQRVVQFGQELCEGRGIAFETELSGSFDAVRLTPERRRDIYLVFKEGIHNIVKHSGASRARFCVRPTAGGASLELIDDGNGIPDHPEGSGHGLASMRERGMRAGIAFALETTRGEGTRITLEVKTT